jgi:hypothetical protein
VDSNPSSSYYGRVYVSNSRANEDPTDLPGDKLGVVKLNADGSPADEGALSTGGYPWAGDFFSPWKLEVGEDDRVYVSDFTASGVLLSWDPTISPATTRVVLRPDNYPYADPQLGSFDVIGGGTNASIYVADANQLLGASVGILRYPLNTDGIVASNITGTVVVATGGDLDTYPHDVAVDASGNIYTIQNRPNPGEPSPRVLKFAPFDPAGDARTTAEWKIGSGDDTMGRASGIAVDPTGAYVAVAFQGVSLGADSTNGSTRIFYSTNGALAADLDLNVNIGGQIKHEDTDVTWDAVGNVYYIDNWSTVWRAFSPPGTNQATTTASQKLVVSMGGGAGEAVPITHVERTPTSVRITFQGQTGDTAATFTVSAAVDVTGTFTSVPANIAPGSVPGEFIATVTASASEQFYRVTRASQPPPVSSFKIQSIAVSGNSVTLLFSGAATNQPSAFQVQSGTNCAGPYAVTPATITALATPGQFQAVLTGSGPVQFYRIAK